MGTSTYSSLSVEVWRRLIWLRLCFECAEKRSPRVNLGTWFWSLEVGLEQGWELDEGTGAGPVFPSSGILVQILEKTS